MIHDPFSDDPDNPFGERIRGVPSVELPVATGPAPRRRRGATIGAIAIGAALVAGGGLFAVRSLQGRVDPNTPSQAVEATLRAVESSDVVGVIETLSPPERSALVDELVPLLERADATGYTKGFDPRAVRGLAISFRLAGFTEQPGHTPEVVRVHPSGSMHVRLDPPQLPLSDELRRSAQPAPYEETIPLPEDLLVSTRRYGERWYVSLQDWALDELLRHEPPTAPSDFRPAKGVAQPQELTTAFVGALVGRDAARFVELLPPDELATLHDRAALVLPKLQAELDDLNGTFTMTEPVASHTVAARGGVRVAVDGFRLKVDAPDGPFEVRYAAGCFSVRRPGDDEPDCAAPVAFSFVAVQRDGLWYLSPLRTLLSLGRDGLDQSGGNPAARVPGLLELLFGVRGADGARGPAQDDDGAVTATTGVLTFDEPVAQSAT